MSTTRVGSDQVRENHSAARNHGPASVPKRRQSTRPRRRHLHFFEPLEDRRLLVADISFDPTPEAQEMLEHINRMRMNPQGELEVIFLSDDPASPNFLVSTDPEINAAMNFFNVNKTTLLNQWSSLTAVAPLAWSNGLQAGATTHNQRMILQDMQSHMLPADSGLSLAAEQDLATRLEAAGYSWNNSYAMAENIYAYASSVLYGHAGFVVDWGFTATGIQTPAGHRNNIMSGTYKEIGISVILENNPSTTVGEYVITQDFGLRDTYGNPRVLGVVYTESGGNSYYNAGEGEGGVTLTFTQGANTFTTTTMSAGGYQIQLAPGTYAVTAQGGVLSGIVDLGNVVVGSANVKLDLETGTVDPGPTGGTLSGLVWNDTSQNGIKEASEQGLAEIVVYLDQDADGQLDAGERSTMTNANGTYTFLDVTAGSYQVRQQLGARFRSTAPATGFHAVTVTAGSTASDLNFGQFEFVKLIGNNKAEIHGTGAADTMTWQVTGGNHVITVNSLNVTLNATTITTIDFLGKGGVDTLQWTGGNGDDTAVSRIGTSRLTSSTYSLTAKSFEVVNIDGGGGTNSRADLYDSPGNDFFIGRPDYSRMYGDGFRFEVTNFDKVFGYASGGGEDRANLFDAASNDIFFGQATYSVLRGAAFEFYNYAQGFDKVYAYATEGGRDVANLYDGPNDDLFTGQATYSVLRGPNSTFYNYAQGFDEVQAYSNNGGRDTANLYDSAADDRMSAYPTYALLRGPNSEFFNQANNFEVVAGYANNGGSDYAYMYDAATNDLFLGYPTYSLLRGPNSEFYNEAYNFDRVYASSIGGGVDYAYLYDSAGNDRYFGLPEYSVLRGANFEYYNQVTAFDRVYGSATNGGTDIAYLYGSAGDDRFFGLATYSILRGVNFEFYNHVTGFGTIRADATQGGYDIASLYDSADNDHIMALSDYAQLTATGRDHRAKGFDRVNAYSREGGTDTKNIGVIDFLFIGYDAWA